MKREIICKKCESELRKRYPNGSPYPDEHIKFVTGKAKSDYLCDHCGVKTPIKKGEDCCAFSVWADYGKIPYYSWEHKYLIIN